MINCKDEFLEEVGEKIVLCAELNLSEEGNPASGSYRLRVGYSEKDYSDFLASIDFSYKEYTYSAQVLRGTIWYKDYSEQMWSERDFNEDEGERWEFHVIPGIPDYLELNNSEPINNSVSILLKKITVPDCHNAIDEFINESRVNENAKGFSYLTIDELEEEANKKLSPVGVNLNLHWFKGNI